MRRVRWSTSAPYVAWRCRIVPARYGATVNQWASGHHPHQPGKRTRLGSWLTDEGAYFAVAE